MFYYIIFYDFFLLSGFNIDNEKLKAEVLWALKVADSHYSFHSSCGTSDLFKEMFPDSEIAAKFSCSETRCRYLTTHGLAPYFLGELKSSVSSSTSGYVLLFDETLNKKNQMKQMDFMIRVWQGQEVKTRYLTSEFLGHATADDMHEKFEHVFEHYNLPKEHLLQLGMDGPNVNWVVYNRINQDLKEHHQDLSLLHAGSCGMHTVHNAFRKGCEASGWEIEGFLTSAHNLFRDSPARLEDYYAVTGASSVPSKFCRHRWLENCLPARRAIELLPALELFVKAATEKKITRPQNFSYNLVSRILKDSPLLSCQLSFFETVAKQIEPFLATFQSDQPLLPFLGGDLHSLVKNLMQRFVTDEALRGTSSSRKLMEVDISSSSNHKPLESVTLGFKTESLLQRSKKNPAVTSRMCIDFRKECRQFLIGILQNLLEKSPLKYSLVRNMGCLDPRQMKDKAACEREMKAVLQCMIDAHRLTADEGDTVLQQYKAFIDTTALQHDASTFDLKNQRVDSWFAGALASKTEFSSLWCVIQKLLLLSHGQATVERGFSCNKEAVADNLSQVTLRARRLVVDAIRQAGGILKVNITKKLLVSAGNARRVYTQYLESQKTDEADKAKTLKRKKMDEDIQDVKRRKAAAEEGSRQLNVEADNLSAEAKRQRSLTLYDRADALRVSAKDKQEIAAKLSKQLLQMEEERKT